MFNTILMPVDGGQPSMAPLQTALTLARLHRSRLLFLTVAEPRLFNAGDADTRRSGAEAERSRLDEGRASLGVAQAAARDAGVPCETLVAMSRAICDEILDTARSRHCELIVMPSRGRMGMLDTLFGESTTREVLMKTHIPVLVIPDDDLP